MTYEQRDWSRARDELVKNIVDLGFPEEANARYNEVLNYGLGVFEDEEE